MYKYATERLYAQCKRTYISITAKTNDTSVNLSSLHAYSQTAIVLLLNSQERKGPEYKDAVNYMMMIIFVLTRNRDSGLTVPYFITSRRPLQRSSGSALSAG